MSQSPGDKNLGLTNEEGLIHNEIEAAAPLNPGTTHETPKKAPEPEKSWVLFDTGANSCITPIQQGDKMKKTSAARTFDGSLTNCYGTRTITLKLGDKWYSTPATIMDVANEKPFKHLIGMPFLQTNQISLVWYEDELYLSNKKGLFHKLEVCAGTNGLPCTYIEVDTTATPKPDFGKKPIKTTCNYCHEEVKTKTVSSVGAAAWAASGAIAACAFVCTCLCLPLLCVCVPCCIPSFRDTTHYCPNCGQVLGRYIATRKMF